MRFLDTNVLVYALLAPRRVLSEQEKSMLKNAKQIMGRVDKGERVVWSVVHISEFVNIVQHHYNLGAAYDILASLLGMENVKILSVSVDHYNLALEMARSVRVSINDCLAAVLMIENKISELYSFDTDFDALQIKRIIS